MGKKLDAIEAYIKEDIKKLESSGLSNPEYRVGGILTAQAYLAKIKDIRDGRL